MKIKNRDARRYLRQVRSWLPFGGDLRRDMLEKVSCDLSVFLEENPQADYFSILRRMGDPSQIAAACVEEADGREVLRMLRIRRRILSSIILGIALVVTIWAGSMSYLVISNLQESKNAYAVITVTERERIEFED